MASSQASLLLCLIPHSFITNPFIPMSTVQSNTNLVGIYLKEIGRIPLLSHEEEIILGKAVQALATLEEQKEELTDTLEREPSLEEWAEHVELAPAELKRIVTEGQQAKHRMVSSNLRLVVSIAKKYSKHNMDMMDLIQEGTVGLHRGVEKFDPSKGYRFSTYAYWWIRQAMTRAIAEKSRTIRLPIHINEKLTKIRKVQRQILEERGRKATPQEIADEVGLSVNKVRDYLRMSRKPLSLDLRIGDNQDTELGDLLEDDGLSPEEYATRQSLNADLKKLMDGLTPQQQEVISLRYGLQDGKRLTLVKIGHRMGVSRERIRQIEREALKRMRKQKGMIREYLAS